MIRSSTDHLLPYPLARSLVGVRRIDEDFVCRRWRRFVPRGAFDDFERLSRLRGGHELRRWKRRLHERVLASLAC